MWHAATLNFPAISRFVRFDEERPVPSSARTNADVAESGKQDSVLAMSIARNPVRDNHEVPAGEPATTEGTTMKQYLLAVHMIEGEAVPPEEEMQRSYRAVDAFNSELMASGNWVFAGGLLPPDTATVVRAQGGKVVTTDGPFAESKEQIGGFWVIKAEDLDVALDVARRGSEACGRPVEVRPFADMPGAE
jgi:hypothetical protein